jgi:predicted nucleic acid-binding protein
LKRIVIDPNVLLSALVGGRAAAPAVLLEAIRQHTVEMIARPALIGEVRKAPAEPYFRALLDDGEAERARAHGRKTFGKRPARRGRRAQG